MLGTDETKHLARVLRLSPGDAAEVYEIESGKNLLCSFVSLEGDRARLKVLEVAERTMPLRVELLVASVSSAAADEIVEKATELGASAVRIFTAARSQERLRGERKEKRLERFHRVALAALKQSGAARSPEVSADESLLTLLERLHHQQDSQPASGNGRRLVCTAPSSDGQPTEIPAFLTCAQRAYENPAAKLEKSLQDADFYLLIGPEGGFSAEELKLAQRFGYLPASLGPNTLRTETAATAALSVVIALGAGVR